MNNKKAGGARKNAGRKPKPNGEVKKPVTTYHKECDLEVIGMNAARETAKGAIERKIKKQLLAVIILVMVFVGCNTIPDKMQRRDSTRITNNEDTVAAHIPDIMDTLSLAIHRIEVIMRVRDLHDSADKIYAEYAVGKNTYSNYLKARKVYFREYDSVYVPICDKLGLKPEGGKK